MLVLSNAINDMLLLAKALIPLTNNVGEALGGEVEANCSHSEQTKSHQLDDHADLSHVLSSVELVDCVPVAITDRSDHDCTAHLEQ